MTHAFGIAYIRSLFDWFWGCSHYRTSAPKTATSKAGAAYIVCLGCGLHLSPRGRGGSESLALLSLVYLGTAGFGGAQEPHRISVNVDLVVLQATVRDRKGVAAPNLVAQDFQVFEDGVAQTISLFRHEDVPVTVGLVIDHSGSMRPKIGEVLNGARTFVRASNPADEIFVVNFNEHVTLGLAAGRPFSHDPDELVQAIADSPAQGMTALYDAVLAASNMLDSGSAEKKVLLVISDGGDNASRQPLPAVLAKLGRSSAQVYTIGIFDVSDPDRNPGVLKRLAGASGGEAYFPNHPADIVAIFDRIARDIRHQYTLGYTSSGRPGAYHTIRVTARTAAAGKLQVQTRSGYQSNVLNEEGAR